MQLAHPPRRTILIFLIFFFFFFVFFVFRIVWREKITKAKDCEVWRRLGLSILTGFRLSGKGWKELLSWWISPVQSLFILCLFRHAWSRVPLEAFPVRQNPYACASTLFRPPPLSQSLANISASRAFSIIFGVCTENCNLLFVFSLVFPSSRVFFTVLQPPRVLRRQECTKKKEEAEAGSEEWMQSLET